MSGVYSVTGGRPSVSDSDIITLSEWSTSDETFELTKADRDLLDSQVNFDADAGDEVSRITVEYDHQGEARFRARQFVGTVALPDGPTIQIQPKAAGDNLLYLLRYARGVSPTTISEETAYETGDSFIDALAALYADELSRVLDRGLQKEYRKTEQTESQVRGQIQVHRQLQEQGPVATEFACRFNELTTNTIANQAILYAGSILTQLTADEDIQQDLKWHTQRLRRAVDLKRITPAEFEQIQLTRLDQHYTDILRLSEPVIRNLHVENLDMGLRGSYSLLVNMNTVFERVVERAITSVVENLPSLSARPQARTTNLLSGSPPVRMYPDFVVERRDTGDSVLVGDAKWKTDSVSNSDLYQITSYSLAYDAPGILLYPQSAQAQDVAYDVSDGESISLVQLSTDIEAANFGDFVDSFELFVMSMVSGET